MSFQQHFRPMWFVERALLLLAAGAVLAAAGACGGGEAGTDAAALLVKNEKAGSCDSGPPKSATLTPLGDNPLGAISTLTAQPKPGEGKGKPSEQVAKEVAAAARNFVNCWNQRKWPSAVTLLTPGYLKAHFVLVNPADILVVLDGTPDLPYTVHSLGDAQRHEDGRVSVAIEATWVHQQVVARWYFTKSNGRWLLDQDDRESVDLGLANTVVDIDMTDFKFNISKPVIKESPSVTLRAKNSGALPHEVFLVQLAPNVDPTKLMQAGVKPEGVEFWGHTVEASGHTGEIYITGMKPGQYIMVCQFRFPGGPIPTHSAQGMVGLFTVE